MRNTYFRIFSRPVRLPQKKTQRACFKGLTCLRLSWSEVNISLGEVS